MKKELTLLWTKNLLITKIKAGGNWVNTAKNKMTNSLTPTWIIITTKPGKNKIPKTITNALAKSFNKPCDLGNGTIAVPNFKSTNTMGVIFNAMKKLKRNNSFVTFMITDKQFGLIGREIPNWKGLKLTTNLGILSITNYQASRPVFPPVNMEFIASIYNGKI